MDAQITLVIDEALLARADALARRLGLARSALWHEAMEDFLDLHGDAPRPDEGSAEE
jgi:predicted transcriptional regulator